MAKVTIVLEDQGHGIEITTNYEPALGKEDSIAQEVGAALVERVSEACKALASHTVEETEYDENDD
jgi:hypothetical protein